MTIWTNHAKARLNQRGLTENMAWSTFNYPDKTLPGKQPGTFQLVKSFDYMKVTLLGKKNSNGEWLIISCWSDPIKGSGKKTYNSESTTIWQGFVNGMKFLLGVGQNKPKR